MKKSDDLTIHEREILLLNTTHVMQKSIDNLQNTFWFGILEDQTRSFQMLSKQLGLATEINLQERNRGASVSRVSASEQVRNYFKKLVPMDVWFYEYAKRLFEGRWNEVMNIDSDSGHNSGYRFVGDDAIIQTSPGHIRIAYDFPELKCMSTKFSIKCKHPDFYHRLEKDLGTERKPLLLLDGF